MKKKATILLADDHALLRMGLSSLIGYQTDMTVVGEAEDGLKAVQLAKQLRPDVVIMDLAMPVMSGAEATKQILAESPSTKVFILTSFPESVDLARAISAGARGAAIKDTPNNRLLETLRMIIDGQTVVPSDIINHLEELKPFISLSDRQRQILQLAARGFNTDDIASMLSISVDGVKKQFTTIFQKLGVSNRSEAVALAISRHLLGAMSSMG